MTFSAVKLMKQNMSYIYHYIEMRNIIINFPKYCPLSIDANMLEKHMACFLVN